MAKNILIFSDGTGQIGGLRPDQRLSNVYKLYRATRSGPDSTISPNQQVAFYDPGLGAGEIGGWTFKRIRNVLASAVGTGISDNMIDCYEAIIANYEAGDKIFLFGFSRGAYTVRCVANVLNLCGVPTQSADGSSVPRHGPKLRKIAQDAVLYVYEHGSGKPRSHPKYFEEREEKAKRFRAKYGSEGFGADGELQGNVQPTFIGVFDTVAALGSAKVRNLSLVVITVLLVLAFFAWYSQWHYSLKYGLSVSAILILYWVKTLLQKQLKYFRNQPDGWISSVHFAAWKLKDYDRFLDNKVRFARHALAIDENRKSFQQVGWASPIDVARNSHLKPDWFKQCWFAGNHSDIGGSYPEPESRLSDIALKWMVEELKEAEPTIQINDKILNMYPNALSMQHDEIEATRNLFPNWVPNCVIGLLSWRQKIRIIHDQAPLHPSVLERTNAANVSHLGIEAPYRPEALKSHIEIAKLVKG
jgi:uncharacterized protein (DUF2235 family)